jgi:hypothetical protein
MTLRIFGLALTLALAVPSFALAQAPPPKDLPVRPKAELNNNPSKCVQSRETVGQGSDLDVKSPASKTLSQQLAQSNGVICPPPYIDQGMKKPAPPSGTMPVIPPPGSAGGNPNVQPK